MEKNRILLIDMYGLIIKESKGYFIPYTFERFDSSEHERLKKAFREERCFTRAQLGELTNAKFLSYLGYAFPKETMVDYLENYLTLDEMFIDFAEKYSKIYDMCLLSNDVLEWSEYLIEYYQINGYFKERIVSGQVHLRKPDKEIFLYTLQKLRCEPDQCVFVDNSVKNLLVAEELGIQTILFNRDGEEYDGRVVNDFEELAEMLRACCKIHILDNTKYVKFS